ncbi:MAG: hypothetical protein VM34scaffold347_36 [Phage 66_12]|nr:MAG: hypothetical protein VM34scaffold347_36 [Phage 66_12]
MTAPPPIQCVICTSMPPAQRPANTDGVEIREGKLVCVTHRDLYDNTIHTGVTRTPRR